ncbi:hypothetical protein HK101_011433 [Irineochytrium annulatum]|nr:hypothetical protein HK101_011433 [Irineochytrium annulatum]
MEPRRVRTHHIFRVVDAIFAGLDHLKRIIRVLTAQEMPMVDLKTPAASIRIIRAIGIIISSNLPNAICGPTTYFIMGRTRGSTDRDLVTHPLTQQHLAVLQFDEKSLLTRQDDLCRLMRRLYEDEGKLRGRLGAAGDHEGSDGAMLEMRQRIAGDRLAFGWPRGLVGGGDVGEDEDNDAMLHESVRETGTGAIDLLDFDEEDEDADDPEEDGDAFDDCGEDDGGEGRSNAKTASRKRKRPAGNDVHGGKSRDADPSLNPNDDLLRELLGGGDGGTTSSFLDLMRGIDEVDGPGKQQRQQQSPGRRKNASAVEVDWLSAILDGHTEKRK